MWKVAPLAGAWIEIRNMNTDAAYNCVAPLAGAWIEIYYYNDKILGYMSLPSRERGLKYDDLLSKNSGMAGRSPRGSVD